MGGTEWSHVCEPMKKVKDNYIGNEGLLDPKNARITFYFHDKGISNNENFMSTETKQSEMGGVEELTYSLY